MADRHGKSISQVAAEYPAWELPYWSVWLDREPTDGRRIELLLARFLQNYLGAHAKKGKKPPTLDKLIQPSFWSERGQALDQEDQLRSAAKRVQALRAATKQG